MNEDKKFTETETSATENVAKSLEGTDNVIADSQASLADGQESVNENVVSATENVAESSSDHDNVIADQETADKDEKVADEPKAKEPKAKAVKDSGNLPLKEKFQYAFTKQGAWANTKFLANRWFIDAFTGMAQGLFVTLIAGTIFKQIGKLFDGHPFGLILIFLGDLACSLMGAGIGVGIAKKLKVPDMLIFACAAAGYIGAIAPDIIYKIVASTHGYCDLALFFDPVVMKGTMNAIFKDGAVTGVMVKAGFPGNPIGAYVSTLVSLEIVKLYCGKTKLDILLVPLGVLSLSFLSIFLSVPAIWFVDLIRQGIELSVGPQPFIMGVIIAVVMGVLLTMPTSSAAIWIAIAGSATAVSATTGNTVLSEEMLLAGGAATVGCACQMVGFAFQSFKENGFSGIISQGVGTSMLQIPNVMKNPRILIPPIVASAICGPLSTCVFKLRCGASGGGMGTSGFVGIIDIIAQSGTAIETTTGTLEALPAWQMWLGIILLMIVLPAVISWAVALLLRKVGWIKENDMSLDYDKKYK